MKYLRVFAFFALFGSATALTDSDARASDTSLSIIQSLDPIAYWPFEDNEPHITLDATERFLGLTKGNVSITRDDAIPHASYRGALSFDGQSGCVVIWHRDELLLEQGTVVCWLRADDTTRPQGLLSKDASGFCDGGHLTLSIANGHVVARLQSTTESYELREGIEKARWAHVACTFGTDGLRLYVNGIIVGTNEYAGGLGATSGGSGNHEPLVFGASTMTSLSGSETPLSDFFQGSLDEVAIFARQLAADEIMKIVADATPQYTSLARAYIANQPRAWWRLDESAGELVAFDQAGSQDGNYNVVGPSRFDGDDYVDVGAIDLDESFTIFAGVEPASFTVSDARIIAKENGLGEDDQFWSLSTTIRDDQARIRFRLRTEEGTREAVSSDDNIRLNQPTHLAVVYDGHTICLYQDGELVSKVAHRGKPKTNAHCHVWLGDTPAGAGKRPFDGQIQDVAIFDHAIPAEEISAIYASFHNRVESEPAVISPDVVAPTDPAEVLPIPRVDVPPVIEAPLADVPPETTLPQPFVHRCPLCGVQYHGVPIRRVTLPGTSVLPFCHPPTVAGYQP